MMVRRWRRGRHPALKRPTITVRRMRPGLTASTAPSSRSTRDLCTVKIQKYVCIHDCGNMINPMIVEGQVYGGIAQGIGRRALREARISTRRQSRQCESDGFSGTLRDRNPAASILHLETPSPLNPLGVKGVGEAGCIAVGAVVASAVEDALRAARAGKFHHVPLTPRMIRRRSSAAGA